MSKKYLDIDVYQAAQQRLEYIFSKFDNVLVAFSGGKDSGVLLNLAYDYAKVNDQTHRLGMFHIDYEAQYQATTDYVTAAFLDRFPGIKKYWLCLPVGAQCICRIDGDTWIPWQKAARDIWVRDMPDNPYVVNEDNVPFPFCPGQKDYDVQDAFGVWYSQTYGKTAVLIGIRADESLNRFRAIKGSGHVNYIKDYIRQAGEMVYDAYPLYDWTVRDIWTYNAKYRKEYNRLYDLFYQAGVPLEKMRVASPFNACGGATLQLYKAIDGADWARMVGRVNGVSMTALYGDTQAMGHGGIKKPDHLTWQGYCNFLLNTLPAPVRDHYVEAFKAARAKDDAAYKAMCARIIKNDFAGQKGSLNVSTKKKKRKVNAIEKYGGI